MRSSVVTLMKKIFVFFIQSCLFGFTVWFLSCSGQSGSSDNLPGQIIPAVEAVQARYGSLPLTQRLSGIVEARNQIAIYPEVSAVIVEVYVKNGDMVLYGKYSGTEVTVDGEDYLVVRESDILAIV